MKVIIKRMLCLFFAVYLLIFPISLFVKAETRTVSFINSNYVNVRVDAGTIYPNVVVGATAVQLNNGESVVILSSKNDSSGIAWHNISFMFNGMETTGYVRNDFVTTNTYNIESSGEFENYLISQGFPESYWPKLKELRAMYPDWTFQALLTGLDWNSVINSQSVVGKSLIYYTRDVAYRSTDSGSYNWDTDVWTALDGTRWFAANKSVVAYYMDPRNFLNPSTVLMFESLSYQSSYQTETVVQRILNGTFMATTYNLNGFPKSYAQTFIEAAAQKGVSPIHLASRVRQEQGVSGTAAITGASFSYNNITYSGLYNFFNIGAYSSLEPWKLGLIYANGGESGTNTSLGRPWKNQYSSILGGAEFLGQGYINRGQNTLYLQKWNVSPHRYYALHTHQYMTNIEAPRSESSITYNAYNAYGVLDNSLVFIIPVYNNMPDSTSLPSVLGNPNNFLKEITINGRAISSFSRTKTTYDVLIPTGTTTVSVGATKISSSAAILSGIGNIPTPDENTTVDIVVEAGNKTTRTYRINIIKSDIIPVTTNDIISNLNWTDNSGYLNGIALNTAVNTVRTNISNANSLVTAEVKGSSGQLKTSGNISTGDIITITSDQETASYTILIYGDIDGDGMITIKDLLLTQKHILKSINLNGVYAKAANPTRDGVITIKDLLTIQRHILGASLIRQ